ncbi:MAG TPA: HlyD family efflux transporter periplasmic adaptor subunit [Steroidobacteraceae bacterium]|jgi:HlyD family secretion protein|nr:HlyD family efflux transporter periplasmic adaptor subunit [Steroidobacteraceae bacterium]
MKGSISRLHSDDRAPARAGGIRDTSAQDVAIDPRPAQLRRRKILIAGGAGALLLLAIILPAAIRWMHAEISVPRERVRVATVTRGPFIRDVSAQGVVVAAVSPTLFAPAAGNVTYDVQAGDTVKRGQVLGSIDSPPLRNELAREQAALESQEIAVARQSIETRRKLLANQQASDMAEVAVHASERELKRAEDAWETRAISQRDFEKARDDLTKAKLDHEHAIQNAALEKESLEFELKTARLERDRQRLTVQELNRRVDQLTLHSPVDGMVGTLAVEQKGAVAETAPVITVVDMSAFEIEFQVPESYADDIKLGMPAEVNYGQRIYPATVTAISPQVKQNQVTGRVRFSKDVPIGLRQNQRVATRIVLESREGVLKVERGPFVDSGGGRVAYLIEDGLARRTPITLGATSISAVEIAQGLKEGDQIIVSGLDSFENAAVVRLTD